MATHKMEMVWHRWQQWPVIWIWTSLNYVLGPIKLWTFIAGPLSPTCAHFLNDQWCWTYMFITSKATRIFHIKFLESPKHLWNVRFTVGPVTCPSD
jgi:hypothetical protein